MALLRFLLFLSLISKVSEAPVSSVPCETYIPKSYVPADKAGVSEQRVNDLRDEIKNKKANAKSTQLVTSIRKKEKNKVLKPKIQSLDTIINQVELQHKIPKNLLLSIAKIETNVKPYAINYDGQGYYFKDIHTAVAFAQNLIKRGKTDFSVGCFQIHYRSHSKNFKSLYDMFDPEKNTKYAARLLKTLYMRKFCRWEDAVKSYHSGHEISNNIYYKKIVSRMGRSV